VREAQTHAHNNGRGAQKQAGYFYRREEEKNKKWKITTDSMEQSENTLTMVGTAAAVHSAAVLLCRRYF